MKKKIINLALIAISCLFFSFTVYASENIGVNSSVEESKEYFEKEENPKPLGRDDFLVYAGDYQGLDKYENDISAYINAEYGSDSYVYFLSSDDVEGEINGDIKTYRGIILGDSTKDDVLKLYGIGISYDFDINTDPLYISMKNCNDIYAQFMTDMKEVLVYNYNDLYQIAFYFNNNNIAQWFFYTNTIICKADSTSVKTVQELLNEKGYNCGNPDGIIGNNTRNAILSYQKNNNLFESGEVDDQLLKHLFAENTECTNQQSIGISISDFVKRYNEATDYYNAIATRDGYNKANYITEEMAKSSDSFTPNQNMKLCVNPNTTNKDIIGIINAWAEDSSLIDANVGTGEIMAMIYAFDPNMKDGGDALQMWSRLHNESTEIAENGITYDNYSFGNMVTLKAQYDGFEITK